MSLVGPEIVSFMTLRPVSEVNGFLPEKLSRLKKQTDACQKWLSAQLAYLSIVVIYFE